MSNAILDGTVNDQNGVAVPGALVYVYDGRGTVGGMSSLYDSMGQAVPNPVTTDDSGYWSAYAATNQFYTFAYYWGGRKRWIESNVMLGTSAINTDPNMRTDLASTASGKGDELVGSDDGASGTLWTTIKGFIAYLRSSAGSSIVNFLQSGTGALSRSVQSKLRDVVSVLDFGAIGDNTIHTVAEWIIPGALGRYASLTALQADYPHVTATTDYIDWAAIQQAINRCIDNGGGTVLLPTTGGRYIINRTLKAWFYVTLEGQCATLYPFNAGNDNSGAIVAHFSDPHQWIIDAATTNAGVAYAYNELVAGALPSGAAGTQYNIGLRNLLIMSDYGETGGGVLPYGGVRLHGAPGAMVDNVGVYNVGIGLLANYVSGCYFRGIHCLAAYYGIIAWNDANANRFEGYATRQAGFSDDVPTDYLAPMMAALGSTELTTTYHLASDAHRTRSVGVLIGAATGYSSQGNSLHVTCEGFQTGEMYLNAFQVSKSLSYKEASSGIMQTAIVAAQATVTFDGDHNYLTGTGALFDLGAGAVVDARLNGMIYVGSFGSVYDSGNTRLTIRGITKNDFGPATDQPNIVYETPGAWADATLTATYTNVGGLFYNAAYRNERGRVYNRGRIKIASGSAGLAYTIPAGDRPASRLDFWTDGNEVVVDPDGSVYVYPSPSTAEVSLDAVSWSAEQ